MQETLTAQTQNAAPLSEAEAGTSLWRDAWHRLQKNKMAVASAVILAALSLTSALAPWIAPYSYEEQNLALRAVSPQSGHWLGTDALGRDQLTRLLYGGRVSLMVGIVATGVALLIGVTYGAVSGFFGGKTDMAMMRIVDIIYALPFTIFVILLMVFFGRDIRLLFVAIGAVEWLTMARIVRGQVQSLKKQEFIEAARALGLRRRRIIFLHIDKAVSTRHKGNCPSRFPIGMAKDRRDFPKYPKPG